MKTCKYCKINKNDTEFAKKHNKLSSRCKSCQNIYSREHHKKNKNHIRTLKKKRIKEIRIQFKEWMINYLQDKHCTDCPEHGIIVLQFDHVRGKKKFNIADLFSGHSIKGMSLESIIDLAKIEINKCEIVCANCHIKRTAKTQNWHKAKPGALPS